MQLPSISFSALGALCLAGLTQGYYIDPDSCGGDKYQMVKDMVEQAFTMANIASASVKTTPIDEDAAFLLKQLFNEEGSSAAAMVTGVFDQSQPNNKGETTGIFSFQNEHTGSIDDLGKNDIAIFCDTSRLKRRAKDPLHLYDSKAKRAVGTTSGCNSPTFMYTQTFDNHWDAIQICPWFLQYATAKKYKTKKDISSIRAWLAVKGLDKYVTNKFYTPVDLVSLWDKCMLHEMMHTTPAGRKDDVGGFKVGYGWKNCKNLAGDGRGKNNADSWALFGSAMYWASQGSPIDENGSFTAQASGAAKFKRFLGSGPNRGLAWVKSEAVKRFT